MSITGLALLSFLLPNVLLLGAVETMLLLAPYLLQHKNAGTKD